MTDIFNIQVIFQRVAALMGVLMMLGFNALLKLWFWKEFLSSISLRSLESLALAQSTSGMPLITSLRSMLRIWSSLNIASSWCLTRSDVRFPWQILYGRWRLQVKRWHCRRPCTWALWECRYLNMCTYRGAYLFLVISFPSSRTKQEVLWIPHRVSFPSLYTDSVFFSFRVIPLQMLPSWRETSTRRICFEPEVLVYMHLPYSLSSLLIHSSQPIATYQQLI